MPQGNNEKVETYLETTVYPGTAATKDTTTNIVRRLAELTGDMTARLISIIKAAGGSQ